MKITLKGLLTFLPIEQSLRQETIAKLDSFDQGQTIVLNRFCWKMFYEIVDLQANYEFEQKLDQAREGKEELKNSMYKQIQNEVYDKFMAQLRQGEEVTTVADIRGKIQEMMKNQMVGVKPQ